MRQYLDALQHVLDNGVDSKDRTGVGTRRLFGMQVRYNMDDGFPAVTTKKLYFKGVAAELLWFLSGSSDNNELNRLGTKIWDANANADYWKPKARFEGDLGRVYGVQWRSWQTPDGKTVDQIAQVIETIKKNPTDRRMIVSAWNPGELDQMALPPCHVMFQFFVEGDRLSLQMYQRSCDMFLGVPFNIASYSLLLHMVAQVTGLTPGEFIHVMGDTHIYLNHIDQVREQLSRKPRKLPDLWLNPEIKDIDSFTMDDIRLDNYDPAPAIKAPMAV
ncbi:MAG: Thymidylate synthase [candidate division WS6 bacterium OLB20]|uniref:Thymidylate synthase n=1 Tax=candidate division WS6 bacterium OLB20 TaxID=1617426 RepID=A0A136LVP9_9BACT|nr:MAG: Thymidylate synthase [candidate division WS6 bacterium OLB20]